MGTYTRNISELEKNAVKWWSDSLKKQIATASQLPLLSETHDTFLSILKTSKVSISSLFETIESSGMPLNMFLKHLMIFTDFGGEKISRVGREFDSLFCSKNGNFFMEFKLEDKTHLYEFKKLPVRGLGNPKLAIDREKLIKVPSQGEELLIRDVIVVLMVGAFSTNPLTSEILEKCNAAAFLGKGSDLDSYTKKLYLSTNRIIGGSTSNDSGQYLEGYVVSYLREKLGDSYSVKKDKVTCEKMVFPFDIVVRREDKLVGIEISFQVTTNSTIERKASQAQNRQNLMREKGHKVAYIIDGAGNFQRRSAISTICQYSDCTVAFSDSELNILVSFIVEELKG